MALENKKKLIVRATKQDLFNFVKPSIPAIATKVFVDVEDIRVDPTDTSKLEIVFKEENV